MKPSMKTLALACAMGLAGGAAQADTAHFVIAKGLNPCGSVSCYPLRNLQGSGALTFSNDLTAALNSAGAEVTGVAPVDLQTTLTSKGAYKTISANVPIFTLAGDFDSTANTITATNVGTLGGARITTTDDGFTNTGGWLQMTNISVDLANKAISADLSGDHGVANTNMVVWNYGTISGSSTTIPLTMGVLVADNTLSDLTITQPAFAYFAQALGLQEGGINAMKTISSYGSMTSHIEITSNIPEPSTYLMMGLGLIGMMAIKRRRT